MNLTPGSRHPVLKVPATLKLAPLVLSTSDTPENVIDPSSSDSPGRAAEVRRRGCRAGDRELAVDVAVWSAVNVPETLTVLDEVRLSEACGVARSTVDAEPVRGDGRGRGNRHE